MTALMRKALIAIRGFYVNRVAGSSLVPARLRAAMYRSVGMTLETNCIAPGCFFGGGNYGAVRIGKGTAINYQCFFDNAASIVIGDQCGVGPQVFICTTTHRIGDSRGRTGQTERLPVTIGDNCWIGARALVLPGVTIGDGCVIAAGAVVTSDCPADGLYAGVPAVRKKDLHV